MKAREIKSRTFIGGFETSVLVVTPAKVMYPSKVGEDVYEQEAMELLAFLSDTFAQQTLASLARTLTKYVPKPPRRRKKQ